MRPIRCRLFLVAMGSIAAIALIAASCSRTAAPAPSPNAVPSRVATATPEATRTATATAIATVAPTPTRAPAIATATALPPSPAPTATTFRATAIPTSTATAAPTATQGQAAVGQTLLALVQRQALARATGNASAVMDTFTDDAMYAGLGLCAPAPCVGQAAIRKEIEREIADRLQPTPAPGAAPIVGASSVTVRFELRADSIRAAGAERIVGMLTFDAKGDKLSGMRFEPDAADPQTAAYLAKQGR